MKRRDFIKKASVGAIATAGVAAPAIVSDKNKNKWKMVTTWTVKIFRYWAPVQTSWQS